jgi:hypothetical protein
MQSMNISLPDPLKQFVDGLNSAESALSRENGSDLREAALAKVELERKDADFTGAGRYSVDAKIGLP